MTEKEKHIHKVAMEITKQLIDSGLSITHQLHILKNVRKRLDFCKKAGSEMQQRKIEFNN